MRVRAPETEPTNLDARMERFALAVASGLSVKAASEAAHVSERTGSRWSGLRAVKARIGQLTAEITNQAVGRLASDLATKARG